MISQRFINDGLTRVRLLCSSFIEESVHWDRDKYIECLGGKECKFCEEHKRPNRKFKYLAYDYKSAKESMITLPFTAHRQIVDMVARGVVKNATDYDLLIYRERTEDTTRYTLRFVSPELDSSKIRKMILKYQDSQIERII